MRDDTTYIQWFEKWLKNYENYSEGIVIEGKLNLFPDYASSNSSCEVALEIYNILRTNDLSLDDLNYYINQIGTIISQVNLKALVDQPRSMYHQMISVVFDYNDGSNILLECNKEDSYAYIYLLIRLLYEILLYTKSSAVRSFVYYQLIRNLKVLKYLFGLIYQPCELLNDIESLESIQNDGNLRLEFPCIYKDIDLTMNQLNNVGYPSSSFITNVFDNILIQMLTTHDLNLRIMCLQLLSLSPLLVVNSPQILNELRLNLQSTDDELSYVTSTTIYEIIPLMNDDIIIQFLKLSYKNAIDNEENPQRIHSFVLISLGCNYIKSSIILSLVYRMCWNLWITLDKYHKSNDCTSAIIYELQYYLMISSTLISLKDDAILQRQKID